KGVPVVGSVLDLVLPEVLGMRRPGGGKADRESRNRDPGLPEALHAVAPVLPVRLRARLPYFIHTMDAARGSEFHPMGLPTGQYSQRARRPTLYSDVGLALAVLPVARRCTRPLVSEINRFRRYSASMFRSNRSDCATGLSSVC